MEYEIETFVGAGPIRFGMTGQDVRKALPGPVRAFRRTSNVVVPSDHFTELGIIVNYEPTGGVNSIEFSRPSSPIFRGHSLLDETVHQARSFLSISDPTIEVDNDGVTSHVLGLGFYALVDEPETNDPGEILSVIAFKQGYYTKSASKT
jgi:hypothetical protein